MSSLASVAVAMWVEGAPDTGWLPGAGPVPAPTAPTYPMTGLSPGMLWMVMALHMAGAVLPAFKVD